MGGEEEPVASVAGGHDAVEHVDTSLNGFEDVGRGADAHEVTGLVFGKDAVDEFNHLVHHIGGLTHGEAADGVALGLL